MKTQNLKIFWFLCLIFLATFRLDSFSQTIDLTRPVGTTAGQAGGTATGGVSYTIPIEVLKGTNGMEPKINLAYNSQSGEGIAGFGWNLSAYSVISRQGKRNYYDGTNTAVSYTNNDAFLLDGQHLFPIAGYNGHDNTIYGTENETFSKIESFGTSSGPESFQVTTKDGMILDYGTDAGSKVFTDNGQNVMFWLLKRVTDKSGNFQEYKYSINQTDRDFALIEIAYTGNKNTGQLPYNKIEFIYTVLPSWQNRKLFEGGASITSPFLLDKINVKNADGSIIKKYQCGYSAIKNQSFLSSFTESGSDGTTLNPLTFQYGSNASALDVSVSVSYPGFHSNNTFTGELTGDGKQDVIAARYYYDNSNVPHYTGYDVIDEFGYYMGPAMGFAYTYDIPQSGPAVLELKGHSSGYKDFSNSDYDGDGKADILMISNTISGSTRTFTGIKINYSRKYNSYSSSYKTVDYAQIPYSSPYSYNNIKNDGSYFIDGDFDGDGFHDYILILSSEPVGEFKAFFSSPAKNVINQEIPGFGVGGYSVNPAYTVADNSKLTPIDFDGDGKTEILVQKEGVSYILAIKAMAPGYSYHYAAWVMYTTNDIMLGYKVFPGDFNGDGATDLLVRTSSNVPTATWNILYSTGTQFKSYPFTFQNRPYLTDDNGGSAHHLVIGDFNNDGKSDVWHSMDLSSSSSKHALYISNGVPLDNTTSLSAFSIYSYFSNTSINSDETVQSVIGDLNFDGKPDIFSIRDSTAKIIYVKPEKEENLMVSTTNGLGAQTAFNYTKGYDRSFLYEYDKVFVPISEGVNGHPYTVLKTPMNVLSTLITPNGLGGYKYTYLQYEDAMYHPLKGFLGFKKVSSTDGPTSIRSTTYSEMDTTFFIPLLYKFTTDQYGSLLTENDLYNTVLRVNPSNASDKRFVSLLLENRNFNYLTGSATRIQNLYDSYGNIGFKYSEVGPFSGTVISPLETVTSATSFVSSYTPVPSLPSSTTVTSTRAGQSSVTKTVTYSYNTKGLVASLTDFSGTVIANTLNYTYDNFGNIITETSSVANTPTIANVYDSKGKNLLTKSISGSGITKTEIYTYNPLNDNILTATSSDGLVTSLEYDGFGNITKTTLPDGNIIMSVLAFESVTGRYSKTSYRYSDNGLWDKTYFDILGREVRKESKGFNDKLIFSTTSYNQQGLLYKQTQPQYDSDPTIEVTNTYDQLQRLSSVSNGATTSTYSYSLAAGGLFTTMITNSVSQSSSKTVDASGKTVKTNDNGGQLDFTYDSWGNQKDVKFGSTSLLVNTYDDYGRQISLTDKNAGTITYEYNVLGKLWKQTDAKNNTHTILYDAFGRATSKTGPDGTTSYTYYNDAATGKCNDNITSIVGFSGDITNFQYDNFQRLSLESTSFDIGAITKNFEYNSKGDIIKTSYSSGVSINDTYDNNGILTQTSMTYGGVTQPLFTATAMNSRGIYTGYNYGNGKSSTITYDLLQGVPTRFYTTGIQDLNLSFDANTGNLLFRQEAIKGLKETFTYDNLNRLTGTSVNGAQQFTMVYDGATNNSLGNIKSKSDIGNFMYDAQKINAVRFITTNSGVPTNPPNVISTNAQAIAYTSFLKTATITENGYKLVYTYGQDEQRIKSVLTQNGSPIETKYYLGTYEVQIKGSTAREIHYVTAGNGLGAIIIKEGGVVTPYFVYTDHLGSLLTVTNKAGTVVSEQNFDAWGRNRNPGNWTYSSIPAKPDWLYRGFTGHEHLPQFALINMNGRIYDPATCRMLIPDNYVQQPYNTQSYNRYSYCINNPLKYKDSNGEWFGVDDLVAGLIGGVINLGGALFSGQHMSLGQAFGYFGVGFASGVAFEYGGPLAAGAISGFGNSLVSGSNLQTAFQQGLVGAASFYVGGIAGKQASGTLTTLGIGGFMNGAISGAVGGAVGGFTSGYLNGEINDMGSNSVELGVKSAIIGAAYGSAIGGSAQGYAAVKNGNNFWTGKSIAPGRSAFALDNDPTTQSHYVKQKISSYDAKGKKISTNSVWLKDITLKGSSVTNYEVWGLSKQEMWDIFTNYKGGNISNYKVGPFYGLNGESYFYNPTATSTQGASIYFSINRITVYKFRFP